MGDVVRAQSRDRRLPVAGSALRAQSEARHLSLHGRRAVADRSVRSQAGAGDARRAGHPGGVRQGRAVRVHQGTPKLLGSPFKFQKHGQSGAEISELLPQPAKLADDLTIVRSMQTTQFNHAPAQIFMNTGHQVIGRPSLGSWLSYGLGSESQDLPAFVVLLSGENNPGRRQVVLGQRVSADRASGRRVPIERRSGAVRLEPRGRRRRRRRRRSIAAINDLNRLHAVDVRGSRRFRRASRPTSWRIACRPACRT